MPAIWNAVEPVNFFCTEIWNQSTRCDAEFIGFSGTFIYVFIMIIIHHQKVQQKALTQSSIEIYKSDELEHI